MATSWTVGRKLYSAFGGLLAVLLVSSMAALFAVWSENSRLHEMRDVTVRKLELTLALDKINSELRGSQRHVLIGGLTSNQKLFDRGAAEVQAAVARFEEEARALAPLLFLPEDKQALAEMRVAVREWAAKGSEVVRLIRAGKSQEAVAYVVAETNPLVERSERAAATLATLQRTLMTQADAASSRAYFVVFGGLAGLFALGLAVGAAGVLIVRSICGTLRSTAARLREGSEQVVSAAGQVATSAQSLSQGTTEQAASIEETSASMEEMASMTRKNAENADQASRLMATVSQQVERSNHVLGELVGAMSGIKESSAKVSKIIKTIDEIAFQTNILALNAAVEAARAGEAGMGFAVVADEVRNLAQRAARAARDTAGLLEESGANAERGSAKVTEVAAAITEFTASVATVKGIADEVSGASREQTQGIDQVAQAMGQMDKVTQTAAATAEESAAAAEQLNAQAETSMQVVFELEAIVGGTAGAASGATARPPARAGARLAGPRVLTLPAAAARRTHAEAEIPLESGTFGQF
jgi:methyl-accepting chemotaxis protein